MTRVLSTEQAKASIERIQNIIQGGLAEQINQLNAQGQVLSDANVWDGPLAQRFRETTWPDTHRALEKAMSELEELRGQLQQIATNIFTAGGGQ